MMADVGRDQVSVAETIGSLEWGIFGSAGMGESRLRGDYSCSELGQDGMGELEGAQNNWREGEADVEDGSEPVRDETDQRDVYLDELLSVIEDDPDSAAPRFQATSAMDEVLETDGTMPLLGPAVSHQELGIAPYAPAVPEGHYGLSLAPSFNHTTSEVFWQRDLNGSGEGFEETSDEVLSLEDTEQDTIQYFPELTGDLDYDRPQQNDGSVLASNCYSERLSPGVSRPSRSTSSSPIAMFDNTSRHGLVFDSPFERNSIVENPRQFTILNGHAIVDLTSDDSDGDEEESELKEIDGRSRGKRKLPHDETEGDRKRLRETANSSYMQNIGTGFPYTQIAKKPCETISFPNRSQSWSPSSLKYSSQLGNLESSVTTATSLKNIPGYESHKTTSARRDTYTSSLTNMAQRSCSGEVSTSYDRGISRVLPGTVARSMAGLVNGMRVAATIDHRLALAMDPVKRSEELAIQAVVQAFSLGDEKEELTPDEDLLTMTLLKHQRIALAWMVNRESGRHEPCGGILADDQGLGKTISTISLILKNRAPILKSGSTSAQSVQLEGSTVDLDAYEDDEDQLLLKKEFENGQWPASALIENGNQLQQDEPKSSQPSSKGRPAAGTLVVCPTSVLRQWAQEIRDKVSIKADVSVLVYHGSNRIKDPHEIAKFDVVLSTYSIVSMEVPKQALPEEKEVDNRRSAFDYGISQFTKPKKDKPEKVKKAKAKGKGAGADGDSSDSGPLARVAWFRVVLDEAQSIKNYRTQVARAVWGLRAKRRWCLSGTPIQNSVDDLFSYFRFLRYSPWGDVYKKFQRDIKDPVGRNPTEGYKKLQAILKPIVLRRTKTSFLDGKPIVNLPQRIVKLQQTEFSLNERSFYSNLETESRAQFQMYAAAGTVQNNYVNILWMLLRLRQACDHPMLVKKCAKSEALQKTTLEAVRKLPPHQRAALIQCLEGGRAICYICQDAPEDPVVSICAHVFCRQCVSEQMNGDDTTCRFPKCKKSLNVSLLYTLSALKDSGVCEESSSLIKEEKSSEPAITELDQSWKTSSKIDAMMNTLQALPKVIVLVEDGKIVKGPKAETLLKAEAVEIDQGETLSSGLPVVSETTVSKIDKVESTEKAIVFSQWTSMLDLLETPLKKSGLCYRRLDGTMSVVARDRAVSDFNTLPEVTVMIMSLKAASLGLNMVAANHVLLLDVWWNPTTEDQAIDRAHRIGQTRTVNVSRFTIKNTIEDRILALQERKRQIVASAFGENSGGEQKNRLTVEDLRYLFRV
ncbi:helicase-like transcription factor CHR28 [Physcomitrium patens]|uniref:SNF2 family DNA-dependent ATPase n=2 Tax=Physcomitrium patens TaxID=3218 RepID=A0A2K1IRS1_PHYPA|nr:helicase-like transcription factor CHR28 [Physcomitrium patens]PNR31973.1 hypothetical protein PHYPA_026097 [Physcomitrium patens]|eukprot:XP_024359379.1 helicase-like transcription factor CHR28 [Physcomitrella patens]